jgi:hypothetical protein
MKKKLGQKCHLQGRKPGTTLCGARPKYGIFGGPAVPDMCERCLMMPGVKQWRRESLRLLRYLRQLDFVKVVKV